MLKGLEKAAPDVKYGVQASDMAIGEFYESEGELSLEMATQVMVELKKSLPETRDVDTELIVDIHHPLREKVPTTGKSLSVALPYSSLGFFLEECHHRIDSDYVGDKPMRRAPMIILPSVDNH